MKKALTLVLGILCMTSVLYGQTNDSSDSSSSMNLNRTIHFENDSNPEEISITIDPNTKLFELMISSVVTTGKLTIELYDVKGVKQGNISVGTQLDADKKERVNGNIRKSLKEPEAGIWTIKIIPTKANGSIQIQTTILN
ncbi:MAG TPA: hypothetical protein DCE78_06060 [Bacteroidetes bacterium]|nr:hypothetical protein [Bacteroidota bacterium]